MKFGHRTAVASCGVLGSSFLASRYAVHLDHIFPAWGIGWRKAESNRGRAAGPCRRHYSRRRLCPRFRRRRRPPPQPLPPDCASRWRQAGQGVIVIVGVVPAAAALGGGFLGSGRQLRHPGVLGGKTEGCLGRRAREGSTCCGFPCLAKSHGPSSVCRARALLARSRASSAASALPPASRAGRRGQPADPHADGGLEEGGRVDRHERGEALVQPPETLPPPPPL